MTTPAPHDDELDRLLRPTDEATVAEAIRYAAAHGRRLRVRGSGHAPAGSVACDPEDLVMTLGQMRELRLVDESERIVEADAGIHLGRDPATGHPEGSLQNSLLFQLADRYGWTLSTTGGITHQTLGGFLATASAGGTLQHSLLSHVVAVRLIDGRGEVRDFSPGAEPGLAAVLPSLGLLGVITAVRLRCEPLFAIAGQEAITDIERGPVDLDGPGDDRRLALADFLTQAEYARIEWWPQRGAERLLVWQAQRMTPQPGFRATRYEEFTRYPVLAEAGISMLYVIFGNLEQPRRARALLRRNAEHLTQALDWLQAAGRLTPQRRRVAWLLLRSLKVVATLTPLLWVLGPVLKRTLPWLVPTVLDRVLPLDVRKPGMRRGEPQSFRDWAWQGLPMDNQASDVLIGTRFSELWVPMTRTREVMGVLRAYFEQPRTDHAALARTGLFAYELYGSPASEGWLHPGHSDGDDEWREGALRIDVYWFADNAEDPTEHFFPQFWALLRDHGIPFRLHWGKEQPASSPQDRGWLEFFRARYPRWDDFMALRAELDPGGVFLTGYWRDRLGLWEPAAGSGKISGAR